MKARWGALCGLMGVSLLLQGHALARPVERDLLQSKIGAFEYVAGIVRLELRDAARDARVDLANGDDSLYCTGTIGCWPPGLDDEYGIPHPSTRAFPIRATAATGCIFVGGAFETAYRDAEKEYLRLYNTAKVRASRGADSSR